MTSAMAVMSLIFSIILFPMAHRWLRNFTHMGSSNVDLMVASASLVIFAISGVIRGLVINSFWFITGTCSCCCMLYTPWNGIKSVYPPRFTHVSKWASFLPRNQATRYNHIRREHAIPILQHCSDISEAWGDSWRPGRSCVVFPRTHSWWILAEAWSLMSVE